MKRLIPQNNSAARFQACKINRKMFSFKENNEDICNQDEQSSEENYDYQSNAMEYDFEIDSNDCFFNEFNVSREFDEILFYAQLFEIKRTHSISDIGINSILNLVKSTFTEAKDISTDTKTIRKKLLDNNKDIKEIYNSINVVKDLEINFATFPTKQMLDVIVKRNSKMILKQNSTTEIDLQLHFDGYSLSKSSSLYLTPFSVVILNLPWQKRHAVENVAYFAIFVGKKEPNISDVKNIIHEINNETQFLFENGICYKYKYKFNCMAADIIAKLKYLGMCTHNSCYPCALCFVKSVPLDSAENKRLVNRYPGRTHDSRLVEESALHLISAENYKRSLPNDKKYDSSLSYGIIQQSAFDKIFKFPLGNTVDYMHSLCGGPVKTVLEYLFGKKKLFLRGHNNQYSCMKSSELSIYDNVVSEIKLPRLFQRCIRKSSEISYYKLSEYRNIFFIIFPTLFPFICSGVHREIIAVFLPLVSAFANYMDCDINLPENKNKMENSKILTEMWYEKKSSLFDNSSFTLKSHELLHFNNVVSEYGPLNRYSCFGGESILNKLGSLLSLKALTCSVQQLRDRICIDLYCSSLILNSSKEKNLFFKRKMSAIDIGEEKLKLFCIQNSIDVNEKSFFDTVDILKENGEKLPTIYCAKTHQYDRDSFVYFHENGFECIGNVKYAYMNILVVEKIDFKTNLIDDLKLLGIDDEIMFSLENNDTYFRKIKNIRKSFFNEAKRQYHYVHVNQVTHKGMFITSVNNNYIIPFIINDHN